MTNPEEEQRALAHGSIALRGEIFGTVQSRSEDVERLDRMASLHPLRLAVVEAAKDATDEDGPEDFRALRVAVDALLAAEKEVVA
jgi:hypothetical protein